MHPAYVPELSADVLPASLSRPPDAFEKPPRLHHALHQEQNSVLSLAADDEHIYSGSQGQVISVWDKHTFILKTTLQGHTGSVLALEYAPEKHWLFSASGDSTIRVWSTRTLSALYLIHPQNESDAGDLFSLAWCPPLQTLYFGCQDTSLQWFNFASLAASAAYAEHTPTGARRVHKFFDSYPQYTRRPADLNARNPSIAAQASLPPTPPRSLSTFSGRSSSPEPDTCVRPPHPAEHPLAVFQVPAANVVYSAHYGYVYCAALLPSTREGTEEALEGEQREWHLATGSGDETVKLWRLSRDDSHAPVLEHTFECSSGAVLSLVAHGDTVYGGCQDGHVKVLDLETRTLVRTLLVTENVDVLSLSMLHSDLFTCSADGQVQRWSASFELTGAWRAHDGIVLSSIITRLAPPPPLLLHTEPLALSRRNHGLVLVTGANDDHLKVWEVEPARTRTPGAAYYEPAHREQRWNSETMIFALSTFVSIPSVSNAMAHREDCRQAAIWLRKCLSQLGAEATLLPTGEGKNPLVLATFRGAQTRARKPRILFYGHYDVIAATPRGWASDPFVLTGRNGYLYGRGATDNKGPILAVACAAADLLGRRALELDLVMLIEGEEEAGSGGFVEAVKRNKDAIGPIDAILVSNSTWIAEDIPCITYGLRGVVHCNVTVTNEGPDLHSGVEGGATAEPMLDMVKLLGSLIDEKSNATIPGFYDSVRTISDEERQLYTVLSTITQTPASLLTSRWREPSLTIHNIEVSGPRNSTVIPATVKSHVSLRIVPDQKLEDIADALVAHLKARFTALRSPNTLDVEINHTANWWLGKLDDPWFHALETAVRDEWGIEPLRIREGGSIPSIPYLEEEFNCHALHLPMGQSSDQAHLPNERISLANLRRGKLVVERFLLNVAQSNLTGASAEHSA